MGMRHVLRQLRRSWNTTQASSKQRRREWARLGLERLEDRRLLSGITWVNSGSDDFSAFWGARAPDARRVVFAALRSWQDVIQSFNYSDASLKNNLNVIVEMGDKAGLGAEAKNISWRDGKPTVGKITIQTGTDGHGAGWYLDKTPNQSEEFRGDLVSGEGMGSIINAYASAATAGGPADGLSDLYTVVVQEMTHVVGLTDDSDLLFRKDPHIAVLDAQDVVDKPGHLAIYKDFGLLALLTTDNAGKEDRPTALHVARPVSGNLVTRGSGGDYFEGTYYGAFDSGNASYFAGDRLQPSYLDAQILANVYGYKINPPTNNSTYINFDNATGNLLVRGGSSLNPVYASENAPSNDAITVEQIDFFGAPRFQVSVSIGNPVPGTGPNTLYRTLLDPAFVNSITVKGGDGNDLIIVKGISDGTSVNIYGGSGDDIITVDGATPGFIFGGAGRDTITVNDSAFEGIEGGSEVDNLTVNDGNARSGDTYTLTPGNVQRTFFGGVAYAGVESLKLITETGQNTVNVVNTGTGTPVTIDGNRNTTVYVRATDAAAPLTLISTANVSVVGPLSNIKSTIELQQATVGAVGKLVYSNLEVNSPDSMQQEFFLESTRLDILGARIVHFGVNALKTLTVNGGPGDSYGGNRFYIYGTPNAKAVTLNTGAGRDRVDVFQTSVPLIINGGGGADSFRLGVGTGGLQAIGLVTIDGGVGAGDTLQIDGSNSLDSAFTITTQVLRYEVANVFGQKIYTLTNTINYTDLEDLKILGHATSGDTFTIGDPNHSVGAAPTIVTVDGRGGADSLVIDDRIQTQVGYRDVLSFTVTDNRVQRDRVFGKPPFLTTETVIMNYSNVASVQILGSGNGTAFNVLSTLTGTPVSIQGGADVDIFRVGDAAHPLDGIRSTLTLDGKGSEDTLFLDDSATAVFQDYYLDAGRFDRGLDSQSLPTLARSSRLESITLNVGHGGSTVGIAGTAANSSVTVNGGVGGSDQFGVDTSFDTILGQVTFHGQAADNDFGTYSDYQSAASHTYAFQADQVRRDNKAQLNYDGLVQMVLATSSVGGNNVDVKSVAVGTLANLSVNNGDTVVVGKKLSFIQGPVILTSVTPFDQVDLILDDSATTASRRAYFSGPPSDGTSPYSGVQGLAPADINWLLGSGSTVSVLGGRGDDALVVRGVLPNIVLTLDGGDGRDLLIAGASAAILDGGRGEDILIAGTTDYDSDPAKIDAIMAEWTRTDIDYAHRVLNLKAGANGVPVLAASTVHSNGKANRLTGSRLGDTERDWFFAALDSELLDQAANEEFTRL